MFSHEQIHLAVNLILTQDRASDFIRTADSIEKISQSIQKMEQLMANKKTKDDKDIQRKIETSKLEINHLLDNIIFDIKQFAARYEKILALKKQLDEEKKVVDPLAKQQRLFIEENLNKLNSLLQKMVLQKPVVLTLITDFPKILPETYKKLQVVAINPGKRNKSQRDQKPPEYQSGNLLMDALNTYATMREGAEDVEIKAEDKQSASHLTQKNQKEEKIESGKRSAERLFHFIEDAKKEDHKITLEVKAKMEESRIFLNSIQNKKIRMILEKIIERVNHEQILLRKKILLSNLEKTNTLEKTENVEILEIKDKDESTSIFLENDIIPILIPTPEETQSKDLDDFRTMLIDSFDVQPINLASCMILIAERLTTYPDLAKSLNQLNTLITEEQEPVSIHFHGALLSKITSFTKKSEGANPGYQVSTDQKTYTVKQGKRIGNTLAEEFASIVLRRMEGIEGRQPAAPKPESIADRKIELKDDAPENKQAEKLSINKTVIAPAFLVIKKESATISPSLKTKQKPQETKQESRKLLEAKLEERTKKQLFVASEWSKDAYSLEGCKLFGYEKRKKMAGAFQESMFDMIRQLNKECELGLEAVIYSAIFNADFDLHTENFMLKFNTSNASDTKEANVALEKFKCLIATKMAITEDKNVEEALEAFKEFLPHVTQEDIKDNKRYYSILKETINTLKDLNVQVYFHKIDHDSGFYRYADPKRKVDFTTHRTSPLHLTPEGQLILQPTLHIMELTGAKEQGIDELLLTNKGIDIVIGNTIHRQLDILDKTADEFFNALHEKANQFEGLSMDEKKVEEYVLLKSFYHHITEHTLQYDGPLDSQINKTKDVIKSKLIKGAIYKMNDLHEQLYARVLKIEKKENPEKFPRLKELKIHLQKEIYNNRMELLFHLWPNLIKEYKNSQVFYSQPSKETRNLIDKISEHYLSKEKETAFELFTQYANKHSDKLFCSIVTKHFKESITIPMNDAIFKEKKPETQARLGKPA